MRRLLAPPVDRTHRPALAIIPHLSLAHARKPRHCAPGMSLLQQDRQRRFPAKLGRDTRSWRHLIEKFVRKLGEVQWVATDCNRQAAASTPASPAMRKSFINAERQQAMNDGG